MQMQVQFCIVHFVLLIFSRVLRLRHKENEASGALLGFSRLIEAAFHVSRAIDCADADASRPFPRRRWPMKNGRASLGRFHFRRFTKISGENAVERQTI